MEKSNIKTVLHIDLANSFFYIKTESSIFHSQVLKSACTSILSLKGLFLSDENPHINFFVASSRHIELLLTADMPDKFLEKERIKTSKYNTNPPHFICDPYSKYHHQNRKCIIPYCKTIKHGTCNCRITKK